MGLLNALKDEQFRSDVADNFGSLLQGASNSVASNVSAPVDGMAWLLRKAGVPIPSNPLGGSDYLAQQGLTQEPKNHFVGLLGEGIGGAAPFVAAAKVPQIAGGLLKMGENLAAPQTLNKQTGAIVWHGSPHKFDKFDASKIGTGEGSQSYGHGLYLAEAPGVAKSYADKLGERVYKGKAIKSYDYSGNVDFVDGSKAMIPDAEWSTFRAAVDKPTNPGSLYKVDLPDEHIAKMLDWDKPLSQQAPEVQSALSTVAKGSMTGEQAYRAAIRESGNPLSSIAPKTGPVFSTDVAASENLRRLGIPGIRYLDGGSRGAGTGTSNYVVFPGNEGLLNILERNGNYIVK